MKGDVRLCRLAARTYPCVLFRTNHGEILRRWTFKRGTERVEVDVDGWLTGDHRAALDAPVLDGQMVGRINDLTAADYLRAGRVQAVLLDWVCLHSPPLSLLLRKSNARQPRVTALADFLTMEVKALVRDRVPAGLPAVAPAEIPGWYKRRTG